MSEIESFILERAKKLFKGVKNYSDLSQTQVMECTQKLKFNYIKGLGEMNPEELSFTTMDRKERTLTRVTIKDAEVAAETFRVLMDSKAVEERKAFIQEKCTFRQFGYIKALDGAYHKICPSIQTLESYHES